MKYTLNFLKISLFVLSILFTIASFVIAAAAAIVFIVALLSWTFPEVLVMFGFAYLFTLSGFAFIDVCNWLDKVLWRKM